MLDVGSTFPFPDPFVAAPYWEGGRQGRLMLPRCTACSRPHFYPRSICPHCGSGSIEWFQASGEGYLYTFAVQHRGVGGWKPPYVTAFIDLKEGDRVLTVLRGVDPLKPEEIRIGSLCRIEWEEVSADVFLPFWRVIDGDPAAPARTAVDG